MNNDNMGLILEGISNIKRNKTLIRACTNCVILTLSKIKDELTSNRVLGIELILSIELKEGIKLKAKVLAGIPNAKNSVKVIEDSRGKIYIGLDTSSDNVILKMNNGTYGTSSGEYICNSIIDPLVYTYYDYSKEIENRLIKDGDSGLVNRIKSYKNPWSVPDDIKLDVKKTSLYKEAMSKIENEVHNKKVHYELAEEKYFKNLTNRQFFPVLILDINKGTCDFFYNQWVKSDKSARISARIDAFIDFGYKQVEVPLKSLMVAIIE